MLSRLEGTVAIVTGASSGIGRATAIAFAREGASVVVAGRRRLELEETCRLAASAGASVRAHVADVTRESEVRALVDGTLEELGRLDVAFNAAGATFGTAPTDQLEANEFRAWIEGHLISAFLSTKHELRAMLASGGGSLINVGTFVGGSKALPGTSGYAAAKMGLVGLTRTVAAEYATRGVRANVLISGGVDTPMFRLWNDTAEAREAAAEMHALGRVANTDEIAQAAVFLASEESSFITGSAFPIDGGVSLT